MKPQHRADILNANRRRIADYLAEHADSLPKGIKYRKLKTNATQISNHFLNTVATAQNVDALAALAYSKLKAAIHQQHLHVCETSPLADRITAFLDIAQSHQLF